MNMRAYRRSAALVALCAASCVTVNVYFPEAEVQDLSRRIEAEVQERAAEIDEGQPSPTPEAPQATPGESGGSTLGALFGISPVYAAEGVPEPSVTNPAIRAIIETRARRVGDLERYKKLGVIGENSKGLVETRNLESLSDLKARAEVQKLVRAENADREQLYREIAAAENVEASLLPRIGETYAETLRNAARPGDWIQLPGGEWRQK